MAALIAQEVYVFEDKRIFALCSRHVNVAVLIKANSLVVSYAVAESLYFLKLVEHRPLTQSGCTVRKYAQKILTTQSVRLACEQMRPKTERHRRNDAVICISPFLPKRGYYPKHLVFLRRVLYHAAVPHLILYPLRIIEDVLIVGVDSVAKYNLEYIQYTIKLLTQLYVMPIQRQ